MTDDLPRALPPKDRWRRLLKVTRDPLVERFADVVSQQSEKTWEGIGLPDKYTERQFRLHLPALSRETIENSPLKAVQILSGRLEYRFQRTADIYRGLTAGGRPPELTAERTTRTDGSRFGHVQDEVGLWLHKEVHYLHCARSDTLMHVGAFAGNADVPALCLSFSLCDREYLLDALSNATFEVRSRSDRAPSALVLTRATSTTPLPKNLVSRLIAWSAREARRRLEATLCITAINPLLGFDGASLRAAGFIPFALSPMTYQYDRQGLYVTRRMAKGSIAQALDTPPIVWLVRPLGPRTAPVVHRVVTVAAPAYRHSEDR